ncbi:winged helix-turn-helix domain-containing protein [Photobacterium lipolyticum]|uniref:Helix-turn-helix domain-containing protein n=1 Tax=Photobacterium lipolyticum TaxID=266810 RepID=A0A2T3MZQ5_9GAMM|nr:helix-turn-helix domain-containing protein [Photobacterium lipolyticum]PSW05429.1 helix-turn-helix domain-containing protein [Photobacterium lipolyticum]
MPNNSVTTNTVKLGKGFIFYCSKKQLLNGRHCIELNHAEREILCYLIQHSPRVVSKKELINIGWNQKEISSTSLFQTIRTLRIKLKEEEKGQVIETVPRLGYMIKVTAIEPVNLHNENIIITNKSKNKFNYTHLTVVILTFFIISAFLYTFVNKETSYYHKISYDHDNNTFIYLTQNEDDLDFLQSYSKTYITPTEMDNKLFFIAKIDKYYSVAFCDKNQQGTCIPSSSRAVTFDQFELELFWPILSSHTNYIQTISLFNDENISSTTAKTYNLYIEGGKLSPNLVQSSLQKISNLKWSFSSVSYKVNNEKTEFIPVYFKGGEFTLFKTDTAPFIAEISTKPKYFNWVISENELERSGISKPGKIQNNFNSTFEKQKKHTSYIVFRQQELILWFSKDLGFYWFNKDKIENSNFSELSNFEKCKDIIGLNPQPNCENN